MPSLRITIRLSAAEAAMLKALHENSQVGYENHSEWFRMQIRREYAKGRKEPAPTHAAIASSHRIGRPKSVKPSDTLA